MKTPRYYIRLKFQFSTKGLSFVENYLSTVGPTQNLMDTFARIREDITDENLWLCDRPGRELGKPPSSDYRAYLNDQWSLAHRLLRHTTFASLDPTGETIVVEQIAELNDQPWFTEFSIQARYAFLVNFIRRIKHQVQFCHSLVNPGSPFAEDAKKCYDEELELAARIEKGFLGADYYYT